jgi:hypothetical protein
MDWLNILISLGLLALMVVGDHITFGTWLTPVSILGCPYMALAVVSFVAGPALDFVPLYTPSVLLWTGILFVFWLTGRLFTAAIKSPNPAAHGWATQEHSIRRTDLTLALLTIPITLYAALAAGAASGGLADYRDPEYQRVAAGGFAGHVLTLSIPLTIYLLGTASMKRPLNGMVGGTMLLLMFLRPSKSWIIFIVIASLLYRVATQKATMRLRTLAVLIAVLFCVFNIAYLINLTARSESVLTDSDTYAFLWRHILDYTFSGVLGFSEVLRAGAHCLNRPATVYAPFMNLYALLSGGALVDPIEPQSTVIRIANEGWATNVHTLFGSILAAVGYIQTVLYAAALGLVSYVLFQVGRIGGSVWLMILWCFWATALSCGWFTTYFANLGLLEVPAYCLLLFIWHRPRSQPWCAQVATEPQ